MLPAGLYVIGEDTMATEVQAISQSRRESTSAIVLSQVPERITSVGNNYLSGQLRERSFHELRS